ncbi:MAG: cysteine desulfurase family protein [Planctomycetota bacterium]|jgi:cysteine desulfurase
MMYADHAATTPCREDVADLMREVLVTDFANPSSTRYRAGRTARARIDHARDQVAAALTTTADQITFTSGATESCNLAIWGVAKRLLRQRPVLVAIASEHSCVRMPMQAVAEAGGELRLVPVTSDGVIDYDALSAAIDGRTALVAAMLVNNETGVVHDLPRVAELAHAHGALVLCDATQAIGRLPVTVDDLGCDFLAASAHKFYGPKGSGVLWRRRGLMISPLMHGGGQERGLRPGTENVAGISGLGLAIEQACAEMTITSAHLGACTGHLEERLHAALPGIIVHGQATTRAPGTTMVTLPGLAAGWLAQMGQVACSGGSACATGKGSATLLAMGIDEAQASNALRLSFGRSTTLDEVAAVAEQIINGAQRLRRTS